MCMFQRYKMCIFQRYNLGSPNKIRFDQIRLGFNVAYGILYLGPSTLNIWYLSLKKYAKLIIIQKSLTIILGIFLFYVLGSEGVIYALVLTFIPHLVIFSKEFRTTKIAFNLLRSKMKFIINFCIIIYKYNYILKFIWEFLYIIGGGWSV